MSTNTISTQVLVSQSTLTSRYRVMDTRIGVSVDNFNSTRTLVFGPTSDPVVLSPVTAFLAVAFYGPFLLRITVDGSSVQTLCKGLFIGYVVADEIVILPDPSVAKDGEMTIAFG